MLCSKSDAIWFEVTEPDIGDDFVSMFAKVVIKSKVNNASKSSGSKSGAANQAGKIECVKLLDSKRSQSIGILMTSQRLDSQIIRDALLGFDNELIRYLYIYSSYVRVFYIYNCG